MAQLTNLPNQGTILRVAARKSFSFGVRVKTADNLPVDLTGSTLEIVMKSARSGTDTTDDAENLITNSTGILEDPVNGWARFDLQASDLSAPDGEYPFIVVLTTPDGYSIPAIPGIFVIEYNPEFHSLTKTYDASGSGSVLDVIMKDQQVINVTVGSPLPPGFHYLSSDDKAQLDAIFAVIGDAGLGTASGEDIEFFALNYQGVPGGGANGSLLSKTSDYSWETNWVAPASIVPPQGTYGSIIDHGSYSELVLIADTLDATGIADGYVPTANGGGTWGWELGGTGSGGTTDADEIVDGDEKVMMTVAERDKLESLAAQVNADWNATSGVAQILHKPNVSLVGHTHRFLELDGVTRSTEAPAPGEDGDLHVKVPPAVP